MQLERAGKMTEAEEKRSEMEQVGTDGMLSSDPKVRTTTADRESRAATEVVDLAWARGGNAAGARRILAKANQRPAVRALKHSEEWDKLCSELKSEMSSDARARHQSADLLKAFMKALGGKGGGKSAADEAAMDAAVAAVVGSAEDMKGMKSAHARLYGLGLRRINRCINMRADLFDGMDRHWKVAVKGQHKNRYPEAAKMLLCEWLHEIGKPDNGGKRTSCLIGVDVTGSGQTVYDEHPPMILPGNFRQSHAHLTGRDSSKAMVRCPDTGKMVHPTVNPPADVWAKVQEIHGGNFKLCHRTLEKLQCECMITPNKRKEKKCVCPLCHEFQITLAQCHHARPHWHKTAGVDARTELQKQFSRDPDTAVRVSTCSPIHLEPMDLSACNSDTGALSPGVTPFMIRNVVCHNSSCTEPGCGWDALWAGSPLHTVIITDTDEGGNEVAVRTEMLRGNATEFAANTARVSWLTFQKVPLSAEPAAAGGDDEEEHFPTQQKPSTTTMLVPVTGSRAAFMLHLHDLHRTYKDHLWGVIWHRQVEKRQMDMLGRRVCAAALATEMAITLEPWQTGALFIGVDFSTTVQLASSASTTGSFNSTAQMLVIVIEHDFRIQHVLDLPEGSKLKARLIKAGTTSYHTQDTTVVFVVSAANNNTQFYARAIQEALVVARTGDCKPGTKGEWISDGVRLRNSARGPTRPLDAITPPTRH